MSTVLLPIPELEVLDADCSGDPTGAQTDACDTSSDLLSVCSDQTEAETDVCELSSDVLSWCGDQTEDQSDACEMSSELLSWWYYIKMRKACHVLMQANHSASFSVKRSSSSLNLQAVAQNLQDGKYDNNPSLFWADVWTCWDCNDRIFADSEHCCMANEMRVLAQRLERDIWHRLFILETWFPDEAQLGAWKTNSWVLGRAIEFGEWLFFGEEVGTEQLSSGSPIRHCEPSGMVANILPACSGVGWRAASSSIHSGINSRWTRRAGNVSTLRRQFLSMT